MEEEIKNEPTKNNSNMFGIAICTAVIMLSVAWIMKLDPKGDTRPTTVQNHVTATLADPGHVLSFETEKKMLDELTKNGVIDATKLSEITELNLLWAYGLANDNPVLAHGPITDARYGDLKNMASVGGWTVTRGSVMDHYSKHKLVFLTPEQQQLVEKMAKDIYRPCCNNATYFPDCNHGMAMLGLLEYLASQSATEDQMWDAAIAANVTWFPGHYQTIGMYLKQNQSDIKSMSPVNLLSAEYASASGFAKIASKVTFPTSQSGDGCGINSAQTTPTSSSSGCGI